VQYNPNKSGEQAIKCPVHEERNASCRLNLGRKVMMCNACEFKGSVIDLVIAKEGLDVAAAFAFAESIAGRGDEPGTRVTSVRPRSIWRAGV
jgi:hypothetical protein